MMAANDNDTQGMTRNNKAEIQMDAEQRRGPITKQMAMTMTRLPYDVIRQNATHRQLAIQQRHCNLRMAKRDSNLPLAKCDSNLPLAKCDSYAQWMDNGDWKRQRTPAMMKHNDTGMLSQNANDDNQIAVDPTTTGRQQELPPIDRRR